MNTIRKIATFLLNMGVLTIALTIVQPKPSVDTMFRIVAGIVIVICLLVLAVVRLMEKKGRQEGQTKDAPSTSPPSALFTRGEWAFAGMGIVAVLVAAGLVIHDNSYEVTNPEARIVVASSAYFYLGGWDIDSRKVRISISIDNAGPVPVDIDRFRASIRSRGKPMELEQMLTVQRIEPGKSVVQDIEFPGFFTEKRITIYPLDGGWTDKEVRRRYPPWTASIPDREGMPISFRKR